jgi:hypothetical protein
MGGNIITQSTEEKDLGITIDEKLVYKQFSRTSHEDIV